MLPWCFKHLSRERWQIIASFPVKKIGDDSWAGVNITYYGFIVASAQVIAVSVFFVLLGAIGVPRGDLAMLAAGLLLVCLPASKIVAKVVEKKSNTFTVGGASFVGILSVPLITWLFNGLLDKAVPVLPFLGALSVAYAFGEGLGRLACLSFGCCYGQPLSRIHPRMASMLRGVGTSFEGKMKKAAYEAGLENIRVVPVQAMTSVICVIVGLVGAYLFFRGEFRTAFIIPMASLQSWRFVSETLRADYRGKRKISVYQVMSLAATLFSLVFAFYAPEGMAPGIDLMKGVRQMWSPEWIIFVQILWVSVFFYLGRSRVTGSKITLYVRGDMI